MAVEIAIVGYSNNPPLQPFYVLLGATITCVGLGWRLTLGVLRRVYAFDELSLRNPGAFGDA
jgi:hypothetical protein